MARHTASIAILASFALSMTLDACSGRDRTEDAPRSEDDPRSTGERPAARQQHAVVGGDVVATVDGEPITLADVEAAAREAQTTPALALRHLEEELVLAHLAEASDVADDPEVDAAARRASVRELLHRVIEAPRTPESVPEADVEARREQIAAALSQPETRRATHVLVRLDAGAEQARVDAAFRVARRIRDELAAESDPSTAMDRFAGREGAFEVVVEHLDPMRPDDLEAPFAQALFAAPSVGLLPDVVRTSYGVHVVDLTEIVPPWEVPRDEWMPALRRQLAAEARAAATDELAAQLAQTSTVLINDAALRTVDEMPAETLAGSVAPSIGPATGAER